MRKYRKQKELLWMYCVLCVCQYNAISMEVDREGFKYPSVDSSKCVFCGLCLKVCPLQQPMVQKETEIPKVYAAKHLSTIGKMNSSYGGVFTVLYSHMLRQNAVYYGVGFNSKFDVVHMSITSEADIGNLRGSKYVQSDLKDTFSEIKNNLRNGKRVLFSGTPCQNAGLRNYLDRTKTDVSNLVYCDVICHGTPSRDMERILNIFKNKVQF